MQLADRAAYERARGVPRLERFAGDLRARALLFGRVLLRALLFGRVLLRALVLRPVVLRALVFPAVLARALLLRAVLRRVRAEVRAERLFVVRVALMPALVLSAVRLRPLVLAPLRVLRFLLAVPALFGSSPGACRCCAALRRDPGWLFCQDESCRSRFLRNFVSDPDSFDFALGRQLPCEWAGLPGTGS